MRYTLAALMGLIALGGVQARALPGVDDALDKRAPELDFIHISDYPLDDPRNDGLAKRAPKLDFTHVSDYSLDDPRNDGLDKRVAPLNKRAGGGSTPRPPPPPPGSGHHPTTPGNRAFSRPKLGQRPDPNGEPETPGLAIERTSMNDRSDIVQLRPCRNAKRDLRELKFNAPLDKRSGDEFLLDWTEWQEVFKAVDEELASLGKTMKLYVFGGISGIALDSRGAGGKTEDFDFMFHPDTPPEDREALMKIIKEHREKNPGKFASDYMNDQVDKHADSYRQNYIVESGDEKAWAGSRLTIMHGPWPMQLIQKMDRIAWMRQTGMGVKLKDEQDSKKFLEKTLEWTEVEKINMMQLKAWGSIIDISAEQTENIIANSLKVVGGDNMDGFEEEVKEIVRKAGC